MPVESLSEWKNLVTNEVSISSAKHDKLKINCNMLRSDLINDSLERLHPKFIVAPIDKGKMKSSCGKRTRIMGKPCKYPGNM